MNNEFPFDPDRDPFEWNPKSAVEQDECEEVCEFESLVTRIPEEVIAEYFELYGDDLYLFEAVVEPVLHRDIIIYYTKEEIFQCPVKDYYFACPDEASEEAYRLNRRLGLSDEEIDERISAIVEGEEPELVPPSPETMEAASIEVEAEMTGKKYHPFH